MQARLSLSRGSDRGRTSTVTRLSCAFCLILLLASVPVPRSAAQDESSDPQEIEMDLVAAPVAYGPGDRLRIRFRIANGSGAAVEGGRIRVGIRDRVRSRSALQASLEADPGFESSALPIDLEETIGADETRDVIVNEPVASFPTLAGATDGGVFPATFSLQEAAGEITFASVTIPLIYHPEPPERPVDVHVLLPLNDGPSRDPSGSFVTAEEQRPTLIDAISEGGWLDAYLEVLEEVTRQPGEGGPLRISIAPTPRLLEELADLADGAPLAEGDGLAPDSPDAASARRALERLRLLLGRDVVDPILVPYASPDLPSLVANLPLRHMVEQFSAAEDVWERVMEVDPVSDWVFPPGARLDAPALEQLQLLRPRRKVFLGEDSVIAHPATSAGCPEPFLSFSCAIQVRTDAGLAEGLLVDRPLERSLGRLGAGRAGDRLTMQQFFAETAMVHAEIPGTEGRVLQVTLPEGWRPPTGLARTLLAGLRAARWIRPRSATGALETSAEIVDREIVDRAPAPAGGADERFHSEIERARALLDSYASVVPAGSARLQRLRRNLLVAVSNSWLRRQEEAARYVTGSIDEVHQEFDKIAVTGPSEITLTSKRGPLQIVVSNDTNSPVRLALRFVSPDLRFDDERIVDTYQPGSHPLTLEPAATGSGVFQVAVRLETLDGFLVDEKRIVVRSTSFNQVALGLTVGAFAFLVLFYVFKAVRKRADGGDEGTSPA